MLRILLFVLLMFLGANCYAKDYSAWINACSEYRDVVENILTSEGVSKDYYYLMIAESKCTDKAKSNKGALGFWQLMPATSRHYGCSNPHDIECATRAAARYIKKLSREFKTFNDVIIAYNMGGHNYRRLGATREARGLVKRVNSIIKQDKGAKHENQTYENQIKQKSQGHNPSSGGTSQKKYSNQEKRQ